MEDMAAACQHHLALLGALAATRHCSAACESCLLHANCGLLPCYKQQPRPLQSSASLGGEHVCQGAGPKQVAGRSLEGTCNAKHAFHRGRYAGSPWSSSNSSVILL